MSNKSHRRFHASPCTSTANKRHLHMPLPFSGLSSHITADCSRIHPPHEMEELITLGKGRHEKTKKGFPKTRSIG